MNKVIVIVAEGKGKVNSADYITLKLFNTEAEAKAFIEDVNDLESKYWTYAEIVKDGQKIQPWHGSFSLY